MDKLIAQRRQNPLSRAASVLNAEEVVQIRQFAGFITKIRHNHLWEDLPWTRLLLSQYKIETRIFTAYTPLFQSAGNTAPLTRTQKTFLFADTLRSFLIDKGMRDEFPALIDVLNHESIIFEAKCTQPNNIPANIVYTKSTELDVPLRIAGFIRCAEFEYSPRDVIPAVKAGGLLVEKSHPDNRYFVYWKPLHEGLSIFGVDRLTFTLISLIQAVPGISASELHATVVKQLDFDFAFENVKASLSQLTSVSLIHTLSPLPSCEAV